MPHFRIEYSANLEGRTDLPAFCRAMHAAILATGLFELGAVRVRAFRAEHVVVADDLPENAFLDAVFRVGEGRTPEQLKVAGDALFAAAQMELAPLFGTPHFMLSLSIEEINGSLSWKRNAIHPRLRGA